ncbi:MAG TPA: hypothetical protein VG389_27415, partial [Myxococcota bacterium]|nr:hypothetical protein [Myxococcota bacterium]
GMRVAVALDGAPASTVAGNRFDGNAVAVRISGGAPLVALNAVRGPGAFGVQASGSDTAVALNVFTGVAVAAAFAGAGSAPLFAGNTVADTSRMGVFFDEGVRGEVRGAAFVHATAAVVVVDAALGGAGRNLFWENTAGDYLRDAERKGALAPLLPPPTAGDVRADPRLDAATFVPAPGSPMWGAGDAAALGRAGLADLLGAPLPAPPIGALGLPAPAPRPGLNARAPPRDVDELRMATPSDLRLLLSLVRDDCGGAFEARPARDGTVPLRCARCGRLVSVRPAVLRRP